MNRQEHILFKVAEEAGEVAQAAGKCGVFGIYDHHPKNCHVPNIDLLVAEANDLIAVIEMLDADTSALGDRAAIERKKRKVETWMKYSKAKGTLTE